MMKSSIGKFTFFWIVGMVSVLSANEDKIFPSTVEKIFFYARNSIDRVEQGKIFFKPDKVYVYQDTVYVEDMTGTSLAIPASFSPEGRPFMQVGESVLFNLWKCECGWWNHKWDHPTSCPNCGRSR